MLQVTGDSCNWTAASMSGTGVGRYLLVSVAGACNLEWSLRSATFHTGEKESR